MNQQADHVLGDSNSTPHDESVLSQQVLAADRWQTYQMLPDLFVQRKSATRVWQFWSALIFVLLAALSGIASAFWAQGHKAQTRHANLVAISAPLNEMRRESSRLEHENKIYNEWIQAVQSAQPDDSVLQTLLAIAESTESIQQDVTIRSVEIKLPLEHTGSAERPAWAKPDLVIGATAWPNRDAQGRVKQWVSELGKSERIVSVDLKRGAADGGQSEIEVVGVPRSTKVVP